MIEALVGVLLLGGAGGLVAGAGAWVRGKFTDPPPAVEAPPTPKPLPAGECAHLGDVAEVVPYGEVEPVAWLCSDCGAKVEKPPAAVRQERA